MIKRLFSTAGRWAILTLIVIAVIGGFYLLGAMRGDVAQLAPISRPTERGQQPSNWTTYQSKKLAFSVSFPQAWFVKEVVLPEGATPPAVVYLSSFDLEMEASKTSFAPEDIKIDFQVVPASLASTIPKDADSIVVDNRKGYQFTKTLDVTQFATGITQVHYTVFPQNGSQFLVSAYLASPSAQEELFAAILASLSFEH